MANGAFKFKDNSGNVVSFISGSGSNISFSGGTLDLSGMTGLTLGNLTLSGTTQNALSASHAASYLLTSSFNTYSGTTDTVIGTLQTSTSSLNSFTSSATTRLNSIEGVSGSYATTGSNLFKGNQTISGSIIPAVDNTYDLGSSTYQFRDLYLSSASLYIDGTKVLGSTAQELQITTDTGQSFKILEAGSDNITLQSADGNIELKSSGGGDVILDPTTGVIALKGTTTLYAGNKLLSSDGNAIQVGNSLTVTGSMIVTGYIETQELRTTYISSSILYRSGSTKFGDELTDTHSFTGSLLVSGTISVPGSGLISGSSQVLNGSGVFSGSAQLPSGIISSSAQTIANLPSGIVSGSAQTIANLPSGTVSGSSQILNGTGFVKTSGASITYDNSTYLTTGTASSTYQTIIANPVTGTGQANRIPKWTSTSVLSDSVITDNGTNVRVTNPFLTDSRLGVGVGGGDQTYASIFVGGAITTGTSQYAVLCDPQLAGTDNYALFANARIKASTAVTNTFGVYIPSAEKLSGASIVNNYALYIANQTAGSTTNYSIYSSGGLNYFGGATTLGTSLNINSGSIYMPGAIGGRTGQIEFANSASATILGMPNLTTTFSLKNLTNGIVFTNDNYGDILAINTTNVTISKPLTVNGNQYVNGDYIQLGNDGGALTIHKTITLDGQDYRHRYILLCRMPTFGNTTVNCGYRASIVWERTNGIGIQAHDDFDLTVSYGNAISYSQKSYQNNKSTLVQLPYGGLQYLALYIYEAPGYSVANISGIRTNYGGWFDANEFIPLNYATAQHSSVSYSSNATTFSSAIGVGTINPRTKLQVTPVSNAETPVLGTATGAVTFTSANTNYGIQFNSTSDGSYFIQSQRFDASATAYALGLNPVGGYVYLGKGWGAANHRINLEVAQGNNILVVSAYAGASNDSVLIKAASGANPNDAGTTMGVTTNSATGRSISAGGTINASGNDYAEYMLKGVTDNISKGDIVGIDNEGLLTNIFSDSVSFVVKSTNPSYVGGDAWGNIVGKRPSRTTDQTEEDFAPILAEFETRLEIERQKVDRIAFSGQVPVNVTGSTVGDYIIPISTEDGKITGQAITNPSFEQYKISVGKVWKIMEDGRAFIAVKIG